MYPARLIDVVYTVALIVLCLLVAMIMAGVPYAWRGSFC